MSVRLLDKEIAEAQDWALTHVGFAMAKTDEAEALLTLAASQSNGETYTDELNRFNSTSIVQKDGTHAIRRRVR